MRVLITGHTGFVGKHLAALVADEGHAVSGLSLTTGCDIRDYEHVRELVEAYEPDEIHHLAAQAYVPEANTDPRRGFDVNLIGTLNLLEAVRHTGCRARVHIAGTSEEYGYDYGGSILNEATACRPTSVYGVTKLAAGQLGLAYSRIYGIPVVHTRAFNHTGPGHQARYAIPSFARQIALAEQAVAEGRSRPPITHGNLHAVRDYTDVRDVVRAYRVAIRQNPGVYNVCTSHTRSLSSILDGLISLSDTPMVAVPDEALYRPGMETGDAPLFYPQADKLINAGWQPQIKWHRTLADILGYWRESLPTTKETT
mgnify:CR=1 FL=1